MNVQIWLCREKSDAVFASECHKQRIAACGGGISARYKKLDDSRNIPLNTCMRRLLSWLWMVSMMVGMAHSHTSVCFDLFVACLFSVSLFSPDIR